MNLLCRGTVMVGAAYAIDSKYFEEIGTYDKGMTVWGGENLEMAWRVCLQNKGLAYISCVILFTQWKSNACSK